MVNSMTGYGCARGSDGIYNIFVEIKSVNHRYFECSIRIPRKYMQTEDKVRSYLQKHILRGKIDVNISVKEIAGTDTKVTVNSTLFGSYFTALKSISEQYGLELGASASTALHLPDVITVEDEQPDNEKLWDSLKNVIDEAIGSLKAQRIAEGERLKEDILIKCGEINNTVDEIESDLPRLCSEYEKRLRQRIQELLSDRQADEQRILTEVAVMADKTAVDEEIVRLRSHCSALSDILTSERAEGKKMDFIVQEMNRETNTICSKISDIDITRKAIEIKSCIEKIREQIQNIE